MEANKPPRRLKKRPPRDERLKQIATAAARLFYKKGYLQTSMREIAEVCGISKGNLYHYIDSKEELLNLFMQTRTVAFNESNEEMRRELLSLPPAVALRRAVEETLTTIDRMQETTLFWYQESRNLGREQLQRLIKHELHVLDTYTRIIEKGCNSGEFAAKDPKLAACHVIMACDAWALKRWHLRKEHTLGEYIEKCQETALAIAMAKGKSNPDKGAHGHGKGRS